VLLPWQWAGVANAADASPNWQTCVDMQDKKSAESELDCYRQAAQDSKHKKSIVPLRSDNLAKEWAPSNDPMNVYKQNYVLVFARASSTNSAPTSPNTQSQVLIPSTLDDRDLKFQFSMKHDLADFNQNGSLWFGYTQLSFWQFYDATGSRPFRENNYEPEFIYAFHPGNWKPIWGMTPSVLNVGLVHQSNGQSNPRSRSWNRVYVQAGAERSDGAGRRLVLLARVWQRIKEDWATDDNPDITDYLGYREVELRYSLARKWEASAIAKARSFQLDIAAPWESIRLLTLAAPGEHNTNIHLQYFSGYGESLIDYNHKHSTWGVGLSFPFE